MQPALQPLPYDPIKSFTPVARVGKGAFVLVVTPSVPAGTVKEFIAYAKQNPGKLNFGTAGAGTSAHMFMELFKVMADIMITPVHFKGGNQQVIDLLGGHTHGTMISLPAVRPHIAAGRLKALATTAAQRTVFLPEVPTLAEAGVAGYGAIVWWGILLPAGVQQTGRGAGLSGHGGVPRVHRGRDQELDERGEEGQYQAAMIWAEKCMLATTPTNPLRGLSRFYPPSTPASAPWQ